MSVRGVREPEYEHTDGAWRHHPIAATLLPAACGACGVRDQGFWSVIGRFFVIHDVCKEQASARLETGVRS